MNLVVTIARSEDWNGGLTSEQLAGREQEIKEMQAELLEVEKEPVDNEEYISQLKYLIESKRESLIRLIQG